MEYYSNINEKMDYSNENFVNYGIPFQYKRKIMVSDQDGFEIFTQVDLGKIPRIANSESVNGQRINDTRPAGVFSLGKPKRQIDNICGEVKEDA